MVAKRDERFGVLVKRDVAALVFVKPIEQGTPRTEEVPKPTVVFPKGEEKRCQLLGGLLL